MPRGIHWLLSCMQCVFLESVKESQMDLKDIISEGPCAKVQCKFSCGKQFICGRRPAEKSSPAESSLSSLTSFKSPNEAVALWIAACLTSSRIFPILYQTSHRRKACLSVNWYSSQDSPLCSVKPCSVLWLWRCRLVLLKSCLISRHWNGGCGKVWQQQIKGEW